MTAAAPAAAPSGAAPAAARPPGPEPSFAPEGAAPEGAGAALVLAAGSGSRLFAEAGEGVRAVKGAGGVGKAYVSLAGKPLLLHALSALLRTPALARARLAVVIAAGEEEACRAALADLAPASARRIALLAVGGPERADSVAAGLQALADGADGADGGGGPPDWVVLHDAARPLRHPRLSQPGSWPPLPPTQAWTEPSPRARPWMPSIASAPKGPWPEPWPANPSPWPRRRRSSASPPSKPPSPAAMRPGGHLAADEAGLVAASGGRVAVLAGEEANFKITRAPDLVRAEAQLAASNPRPACGCGLGARRAALRDGVGRPPLRPPRRPEAALLGRGPRFRVRPVLRATPTAMCSCMP